MRPIQGLSYWVSTLFELHYYNGEVYIGRVSNMAFQREQCWVHHAVCLDVEDKAPSWSPNHAGPSHSLMYFMKFEEEGMPYSENKFVVDNSCVFDFDCKREAFAHSVRMCDEYVVEEVMDRLKIGKNLLSVRSWASQTVHALDYFSKMSN